MKAPGRPVIIRAYGMIASAIIVATLLEFLSIYVEVSVFGLKTGSYRTTLDTNHFGENWSEVIALCSCIPFGVIQVRKAIERFVDAL